MGCVLRGSVREGVFREGRVGSPGTDCGLNDGEFTRRDVLALARAGTFSLEGEVQDLKFSVIPRMALSAPMGMPVR